jgi:hypothetical protein
MSVLLSLSASNVKGNTKRAIVNGMFFIGYCAGCIASPQLWTNRPRYTEGVITALVTWALLFVCTLLYRYLCIHDNNEREATMSEGVSSGTDYGVLDKNGQPKTDLTDRQDIRFRFSV